MHRIRANDHNVRTLADCNHLIRELGHKPSAAGWSDPQTGEACAFSVATWGAASYNASKATVQLTARGELLIYS